MKKNDEQQHTKATNDVKKARKKEQKAITPSLDKRSFNEALTNVEKNYITEKDDFLKDVFRVKRKAIDKLELMIDAETDTNKVRNIVKTLDEIGEGESISDKEKGPVNIIQQIQNQMIINDKNQTHE